MSRSVLVLAVVLASLVPTVAQAQPGCQFRLGFATLHDLIPTIVGDCVDDESHNPVNGDGIQHTTAWHGKGGLMVWRKADNWTAFTDGATTWINGPVGVVTRPNGGPLFPWENPTGDGPTATPTLTPTPTPVRPVTATATSTPTTTASCVSRVEVSVQYPSRGGGSQTVFVRTFSASGQAIGGATGGFVVYYKTVTREFTLSPTSTDGRTQGSWSVGGPVGWVPVVVTMQSGGCAASAETGFQGR